MYTFQTETNAIMIMEVVFIFVIILQEITRAVVNQVSFSTKMARIV